MFRIFTGSNDEQDLTSTLLNANRAKLRMQFGKYSINGAAFASFTVTSFNTAGVKELQMYTYDGSASYYSTGAKVYDFWIKKISTGEFLKYWVPCKLNEKISAKRAANGKAYAAGTVGFYDVISHKFYGNDNTSGSFSCDL